MKIRRSLPPPTDEQLASAEETDMRRRELHIAKLQDEQEQTRLAAAGDPDAQEALRAHASSLTDRPLEHEDSEPEPEPPKKTPKVRASKQRQEPEPEDFNQQKDEKNAYKLMDAAYKKWAKTAPKDLKKANRDLAIDLGQDTALYLRSGIIRLNDIHDVISKLTALPRGGKDPDDGEDTFNDDMDELRKQLRGD